MELRMIGKKISRMLVMSGSVLFLALGACTLPIDNVDLSDKDNVSNVHADITDIEVDNNTDNTSVEPDNNTDNNNEPDNGNNNVPDVKTAADASDSPDGFSDLDSKAFAARAEGLYKLVSDKEEAYLELYSTGDNLYGFYDGKEFAAMELFALSYEGFASQNATSVEVKIASFNYDSSCDYFSKGMPANITLNLTKDGIKFSDFQTGTGDLIFDVNAEFERIDGEMGHLKNFNYRDMKESLPQKLKSLGIETVETPEEVIGSRIILGDNESAFIFDFTEEGLIQVYFKQTNEPVTFYRGAYAVGKDEINGGSNIYMDILCFGYLPEENYFNLCYKMENDNMICLAGDTRIGSDAVWENAILIPFDMSTIARAVHDEEAMANNFSDGNGSIYMSDDGWVFFLSDDEEYYYIYNVNHLDEPGNFFEGSYEFSPGGYILYEMDYEGSGNAKEFGFLSFLDQKTIQVDIYKSNESITLEIFN